MSTSKHRNRVGYAASLCCPRCHREGVANVSENRFPFASDLRVSVGQISEGFRLAREGQSLRDVEILCATCGCAVEIRG